ncbi:MAG: MATE family efflux transporter [Thermodesulfobacteriota bacterium]
MSSAAAQLLPEDAPWRTIWRLAWPQALMMFFNFLIGFVDVYVAGMLDMRVQASLGLITSCLFFLLIVAVAAANGAVAAISQSLGAGRQARALRFVGLVLAAGLVGGVLLAGLGWLGRDLFLAALQVPAELRDVTRYFLSVYLLLLPVYYLFLVSNAVFRARRQVMAPLYAMGLAAALNTALDFGLGLGWWGLPDLGFRGLAWATFGSVCGGAALNLWVLRRQGLLVRAALPAWRWSRPALAYLSRVAWPAGLMQVLWQTGFLVLFAITAALPAENITAMAGMTAGLRVESILFLPGFAFNMTASVLVGNYLGAGRPAEAKAFGFRIWAVGVASIGLLTLAVWRFTPEIAALLSPEPAVQEQTRSYLFYNFLAIPFTLTSMILGGAFAGAGATIYNLAIFGTTVWCLRLPLAWWLGHRYLGRAEGVWIAQLASQVVQSMTLLYFYQFGNWQRFALAGRRRRTPEPPVKGAVGEPTALACADAPGCREEDA